MCLKYVWLVFYIPKNIFLNSKFIKIENESYNRGWKIYSFIPMRI